MSGEGDASASAMSRGNDYGKGKSPVLNKDKGNQENTEKKSEGDVSESVKALIRATMAEELAKLKVGS